MKKYTSAILKYIKPITFSIAITALFLLVDYAEKYPFCLTASFDNANNIIKKLGAINWWPSVVVGIYVFMVWMLYINLKNVKAVFQEFIVPLSIVVFTLITGTIGFLQINDFNFGDAFFAAANLLTLNTSVLKPFLGDNASQVNFWIENARLMGGIFLAYAFILALSLATGKENTSRIRFRWFRLFNKIKGFFRFEPKPFYVVIGDGEKAISLALDLEKNAKRVAFLHQGFEEYTENIISEKKIWYLKGNASSKTGLEKTYFQQADKVYVLNDSEEENFRTIQEMEDIINQEKHTSKTKWFVHLTDLRKRALLTTFVSKYIQTFDINQNIARKLINENPINRFKNGSTVAQVVIIGFGQLAEAIVMQCLRIGHFSRDKQLKINVYFTQKDLENVSRFKEAFPVLFKGKGVFSEIGPAASIQQYTFFNNTSLPIIEFEELPTAETDLVNPKFSLYQKLKPNHCVSLYLCLDSGIDNAAILGTVLPQIAWQKTDVKAYCHYNFPDIDEKKVVEEKLNERTAQQVKVICFGNYLEECTTENIENEKLDLLAKQIGKLYHKIYEKSKDEDDNNRKIANTKEILIEWKKDDLDELWESDKEINRESNRQAADHAEIKFCMVNLSSKNLEGLKKEELLNYWSDDNLQILSEIEHRRWCAEKLLLGWLPIHISSNEWAIQKSEYQKQKLHRHLVPFDILNDDERNKDYTQVMGLPFFMRGQG